MGFALIENQTGCKLKCLRIDNGGKYLSHAFATLCDEIGIRNEFSPPYMHPQNGVVAQCMNRTIQEQVHSMLSMAGLSDGFWDKELINVVHLIYHVPCVALDFKVLREVWTGLPPSYGHLCVFGYEAYVHVPKQKHNKLDGSKNQEMYFLGIL